MDYMDLAVHCPRKAIKFNHSLTHSLVHIIVPTDKVRRDIEMVSMSKFVSPSVSPLSGREFTFLSWPSPTSAKWVPLTQENRMLDSEV